jgi:two-component system, OmpR family, response regulator QseB
MRILIVEDDDRIAKPLMEDLRHQGYAVDFARDGMEGWEFAQVANYDLILLDVMLPKMDGIMLCKRLRAAKFSTPILMLTARDTTSDKVTGLDAGADDYLIKPFELEELSARVRALSRRSPEVKPLILSHENLELNPTTHTAKYGDIPVALTPREYGILECFLNQPNQVLTRSQILEKLWEFDSNSGEETIKTHITNLRKKLKATGAKENFIETVYGIGYRLCEL